MPNERSAFVRYFKRNHLGIISAVLAFLSLPFLTQFFSGTKVPKSQTENKRVIIEKRDTDGAQKIVTGTPGRVLTKSITVMPDQVPTKSITVPPIHATLTTSSSGTHGAQKPTLEAGQTALPSSVPSSTTQSHPPHTAEPRVQYEIAVVTIKGDNNDIILKKATNATPFPGYSIVGSSTNKTFYIPNGQRVHVVIRGDNNDIIAKDGLAEFIILTETGDNNEIREK